MTFNDIDGSRNEASAMIDRIEARLEFLVPRALPGQTGLDAAIRQSVLAPGKRLRPLMTALAAGDLGGDVDVAIDAGCAVEMVHASSLILDDLPCMDDAAMRRGRPATHVTHGEDVAVLSAIAILSGSYEMLARVEGLSPAARLEAVTVLTRAVGVEGLVGGQFADLRGGRDARPLHEIAATNGRKTGALFLAAVEIGAIVAGAGETTRAHLRGFATELGHAFQLLDDLLDGGQNPGMIGKDVNKDAGKSTIVSMLGRPSVEHRIERHVEAAHGELTAVFGASSRLHRLTDAIVALPGRSGADASEQAATQLREQEAGVR
ncbi:polyprenyl synthetase family protein [Aurantimonas sp. A2-1-M11]|uniref:polyprenyl synthetase family protein n=1 Tax=Aurantimonas sp. A2-1-M11 TaxID=3113712 RepID=UPI002F94765E